MKPMKSACAVAVVACATALAVAACGGSTQSSSTAQSLASSATGANVAAARAAIAPYTGHPTPLPVDARLPKKLAAGTKLGYLQCVTPVCGIFATLIGAAVHEIGGQLTVVKAGASSQQLQSAFSSILAQRPSAILLAGIEPDSVNAQIQRAVSAGIPMISVGIVNTAQHHISAASFGTAQASLAGRLMADWVVANKGAHANVAFYTTPELTFTSYLASAFTAELKRVCTSCTVRTVDVSATTFGSTAPQTVVSDLQSHPDTSVAVFAVYEAAEGLPAAMRSAGLKATTIGFAPTPQNLQDMKTGGLTAGLAFSLPVTAFMLVDEAARLIEHAPLTAGERAQAVTLQFLTAPDLNFDVSHGWAGYPDFAQRFAKLWNVN